MSRLLEDNEGSLVAARADREERSFNQSLREEQDQAYLESLRADQEKERKKREEAEQRQQEEERRLEEEREEQERLQDVEKRKAEIREAMPVEPLGDDPNAIKILLKLPNGMRLERLFLKTDSLKVYISSKQ